MSSRRQLVNWSPLSECWKNVNFAEGPLAPYPDMALVSGRFHMKRCEMICLLYQNNSFLGLILELEMALRSYKKLKKHVFLPFEGLTACVKCVKMAQNDRDTEAEILC